MVLSAAWVKSVGGVTELLTVRNPDRFAPSACAMELSEDMNDSEALLKRSSANVMAELQTATPNASNAVLV